MRRVGVRMTTATTMTTITHTGATRGFVGLTRGTLAGFVRGIGVVLRCL